MRVFAPVRVRDGEVWPEELGGRAGFGQSNIRQLMKKNNHQHLAVWVVLISQVAFLATFAFGEHVVRLIQLFVRPDFFGRRFGNVARPHH
jgi:hypothetical protein